jgi:SAM-dependent methyltransferase
MDRQYTTELMDDPSVPEEIVAQAYRGLELTHRWLGNTAAILRLLRRDPLPVRKVLDIGCGQGALLHEIRCKLGVEVVGFDLRPSPQSAPVPIQLGDAVVDPLPPADVALTVCMAHHLSENDLVRLIRNVSRTSRRFILLDLVRNRLPLVLFRTFVCPFLPPINVTDGLTSIRRAYTPRELRKIVDAAVEGTGGQVRHTVTPLYIRQIIDIRW